MIFAWNTIRANELELFFQKIEKVITINRSKIKFFRHDDPLGSASLDDGEDIFIYQDGILSKIENSAYQKMTKNCILVEGSSDKYMIEAYDYNDNKLRFYELPDGINPNEPFAYVTPYMAEIINFFNGHTLKNNN